MLAVMLIVLPSCATTSYDKMSVERFHVNNLLISLNTSDLFCACICCHSSCSRISRVFKGVTTD